MVIGPSQLHTHPELSPFLTTQFVLMRTEATQLLGTT